MLKGGQLASQDPYLGFKMFPSSDLGACFSMFGDLAKLIFVFIALKVKLE